MLGVAPHLSPITGSGWDFLAGCEKSKLRKGGPHAPAMHGRAWDCNWGGSLMSGVMAWGWVLQELSSSAGSVSLTCVIWICCFSPAEPSALPPVVKMNKMVLMGCGAA